MSRQITITVPTVREAWDAVRSFYKPPEAPNWILSRYSSSLIIVTCGMSMALLISRDYQTVPGVTSHSIWRVLYALAFSVAGLLSLLYYFRGAALSRLWERRLRTAMFVCAMIPSLGWLLISIYLAVAWHGDWARVVPWIFIVVYFGRAFSTPATTLELSIVEEVRSHLPDA